MSAPLPAMAETIHIDTTPSTQEAYLLPKYGANITFFDGGSGTVDSSGMLTSVGDRIEEIRPDWIRFPGGTVSDVFEWERSVGPVSSRDDQLHAFQNKLTPTPSWFGPHEAAELVNQWGGELFGVVNINRSANDAARFVEYLTAEYGTNPRGGDALAYDRKLNGSELAFNFKVFEVGNESGGRTKLNWFSYDRDENPIGALTVCPSSGSSPGFDDYSRWTEMADPFDACPHGEPVNKIYMFDGSNNNFQSEREFINQLLVKDNTWKHTSTEIQTTSLAGQVFYAKFPPAKNMTLTIDGEIWTQTNSLSGSVDEFLLDQISGKVTFGDGTNGNIPPASELIYANYTTFDHDDFKTFETLMKNANPSIKVVGTYFNLAKEARDNSNFLLDGYQVHGGGWLNGKDSNGNIIYPQPSISPHDNCIGRAFGTFPRTLDDETSIISTKPDIGVYFSEYSFSRNLNYGIAPNEVEHALTMCSALLHAGILMSASRDEQVKYIGANYLANLAPNDDEDSMISQFDPYTGAAHTPVVTAMGRAYQLFTRHFGDVHLPVTHSNYSSKQITYYKKGNTTLQTNNIKHLQAIASRNTISGSEYHFVMVMNTSSTTDRTVTLSYDVEQRFLNGSSTIVRLGAKNGILNTVNTPSNFDNIRIEDVTAQPSWDGTNKEFTITLPPATVTVFKTKNL